MDWNEREVLDLTISIMSEVGKFIDDEIDYENVFNFVYNKLIQNLVKR